LTKILLNYSVSYFQFGGLELYLGRAKHTKVPPTRGDGIVYSLYRGTPITLPPTGRHSIGRVCGTGVVASHLHSLRFHALSR